MGDFSYHLGLVKNNANIIPISLLLTYTASNFENLYRAL